MSNSERIKAESLATIVEWHYRGEYEAIHAMQICLEVGGPGDWTPARFDQVCDAIDRKATEVARERAGRRKVAVEL
jgi:hypothetical protein